MGFARGDDTLLWVKVPHDAGGTGVRVGQIVSITPHGGSAGQYDVTSLDTTGNREYHKTIGVGDTLDFTVNYDPNNAGQVVCQGLVSTPLMAKWYVVLPTSNSDFSEFQGVLTAFGAEQITVDGIHTRTVSVQISSTLAFFTGW